jgi:hypothetical protein
MSHQSRPAGDEDQGRRAALPHSGNAVVPDAEVATRRELTKFGFDRDTTTNEMKAAISVQLLRYLDQNHILYSIVTETGGDGTTSREFARKREQREALVLS